MYQEFSARSLLITQRSRPRARAGDPHRPDPARRGGSPSASSTRSLQQQIDVVEQELAALLGRDLARRAAGREVARPARGSTDCAARRGRRARRDAAPCAAARRSAPARRSRRCRTPGIAALGDARRSDPSRSCRCSDCAAVRPCTATAAAPASSTSLRQLRRVDRRRRSSRRASSPSPESSPPWPSRAITPAACSGSRIRLQPALCLAIFGTGQPMLTSTMSAPMPSTICAAVGHLLGIAAEDLDRDRPLFFGVFGVFERAIDAAHQPLGADHLGDDEAAAAVALDQPAERRVGHAGHRRERRAAGARSIAPIFHRVRNAASVPAGQRIGCLARGPDPRRPSSARRSSSR